MKVTKNVAIALLMCGVLAACADNTGAIDQMGHNGFDRMACNDFAALAKDMKFGAVTLAQAQERAAKLLDESSKGGAQAAVRQAGTDFAASLALGNQQAIGAATVKFQQACAF
jgi:hypothetical protein